MSAGDVLGRAGIAEACAAATRGDVVFVVEHPRLGQPLDVRPHHATNAIERDLWAMRFIEYRYGLVTDRFDVQILDFSTMPVRVEKSHRRKLYWLDSYHRAGRKQTMPKSYQLPESWPKFGSKKNATDGNDPGRVVAARR